MSPEQKLEEIRAICDLAASAGQVNVPILMLRIILNDVTPPPETPWKGSLRPEQAEKDQRPTRQQNGATDGRTA